MNGRRAGDPLSAVGARRPPGRERPRPSPPPSPESSGQVTVQREDPLQPLEQAPPLRQRIHEQLEKLITTGVFPPGTRLVEGELAHRLGVSRGPVRETLQALSTQGFVDLRHRQGAFVHVPSAEEVEDFFNIRKTLECESAALAARRISPESVERLNACVRQGERLLADGEHPASVNRQVRIHLAISDVAASPLLAQMLGALNKLSTWYLSPFEPNHRHEKAWQEHVSIVDAIVRGDARAARRLMARHSDGARTNYLAMRADHAG